jgi:hypothetical protein
MKPLFALNFQAVATDLTGRSYLCKLIAILLLTFVSLVSCKKKQAPNEAVKEVIVYQEPSYKWKRVKNFTDHGTELIRNAERLPGGRVFFSAYNLDAIYDSTDNTIQFFTRNLTEFSNKPLITGRYYVSAQGDFFQVRALNNREVGTFVQYTDFYINVKSYDSAFHGLKQGPFFSGITVASDSTIMFDYLGLDLGRANHHFLAFKLKFQDESAAYNGQSVFSIKPVNSLLLRDTIGVYHNHLVGRVGRNLMFTMGNSRNYLLNHDLDTLYVNSNYNFNQIFEWQNQQYSIARVNSGGNLRSCLVKTSDQGLNWQIAVENVDPRFENFKFTIVGNKLVGHSLGSNQLWEILIEGNSLEAKELVNEGMPGAIIKAVVYTNNRVFVCTETGVFERTYDTFIEYK